MSNNNKNTNNYLFKCVLQGTYQRLIYPHLIQVVPINKALQDIDLLASSITYSLVTSYYDRTDYYWPFIRRCLCNGDKSKLIYISLVFNKPTSLDDLKVTYIKDVNQLNMLNCSLKDTVLSNLKHIIRD
jgi:hypothetical protein